ncbi:MAG: hypothetical protein WCG87_02270 [Bacteroidota bacterium]
MRPKEFDELIRQKFDQNDFEFNPTNWEKLEAELDRKPGKRNMMLWLPLAAITSITSVAASLAMMVTIPVFQHHKPAAIVNVISKPSINNKPLHIVSIAKDEPIIAANFSTNSNNTIIADKQHIDKKDRTLTLHVTEGPSIMHKSIDLPLVLNDNKMSGIRPRNIRDLYHARPNTKRSFDITAWDNEDNKPKTVISFAGGVNYGAQVNGYSVAATGKRMLGDKFYIEGDIAFVKNNATERTEYVSAGTKWNSSARTASARLSSAEPQGPDAVTGTGSGIVTQFRESNYDLYYAQVTPSIGCNIRKHFSVGVGADMQRLVLGNRPVTTSDNPATIKEIPSYDMGFVGKTECELSKKIKAGLYYRQGLNNVISPNNKYLDRSYVQVQLKFLLLRK